MKLIHRGVSYEYNPPVIETTEAQIGGKYRGLDWRFRNLKKPPIVQPRVNLTYRGVTYNQPGTVPQTTPMATTEDKARVLMINQSKTIKKRQQSLLSRVSAEIGASDSVSSYPF